MRAFVIGKHGGVDELRLGEVPTPEPGPGEVRVALRAIGVNHLDTWVRRGVPGHTFPLPIVPGSDGAGVVDAVGAGVTGVGAGVEVGAEVVLLPGLSCGACRACSRGEDQLCSRYEILGETRDGTCAEAIVVPARNVAPLPRDLDFAEAACMPLVFMTAWSMLDKARVAPGDTVLVHAGGSGVGSAAVQIARLRGARVFATAGTRDKCAHALALGAEHAIEYTKVDFVAAVRDLTGKAGVDVVVEHVGADTFDKSVRCLGRGGRLVTCGATTGGKVELHLQRLFFKNLSVIGSTMGSRADALRVLELAGQGRLRPVIAERLGFEDLPAAHTKLEQRAVFGKIVLER